MKPLNKYRFLLLALAITLIGTACWQLVAAPYSDDFAYMQIALDDGMGAFWTGFGNKLESIDDAITSSINHWHNVNSRLANILCIFSMLLPQWIPDLLHAIVITAMILLILLNINGRQTLRSPATIALTTLSIWLILPWHDNMVSSDFLFNYAWTSALSLLFILIFKNARFNKAQLTLSCILAFLTAWMHEGFTIPTGMVCLTIIFLDRSNRQQRLIMLGAFALGALLCAGPGTVNRFFEHSEQHKTANMVFYLTRYISQLTILWIYLLSLGIITIKKGSKAAISIIKGDLPFLVGAATSFAISIAAAMGGRALWFALIFLTIITFRAIPQAIPTISDHIKSVAAYSLLALTTLFFSGLCYWQNIISSQQRLMLNRLIESDSPCIFVDLTPPQQIPWWTMAIPRQYCYDSNMAILTISSYADKTSHAVFAPARFNGLKFGQWDKIPGNNSFRGEYPLLCSTDSTITHVTLNVGKPLPAMSPIDRLLMSATGGDTAQRTVKAYAYPTLDAYGQRIFIYLLEAPGRTIANREILSIDTAK